MFNVTFLLTFPDKTLVKLSIFNAYKIFRDLFLGDYREYKFCKWSKKYQKCFLLLTGYSYIFFYISIIPCPCMRVSDSVWNEGKTVAEIKKGESLSPNIP